MSERTLKETSIDLRFGLSACTPTMLLCEVVSADCKPKIFTARAESPKEYIEDKTQKDVVNFGLLAVDDVAKEVAKKEGWIYFEPGKIENNKFTRTIHFPTFVSLLEASLANIEGQEKYKELMNVRVANLRKECPCLDSVRISWETWREECCHVDCVGTLQLGNNWQEKNKGLVNDVNLRFKIYTYAMSRLEINDRSVEVEIRVDTVAPGIQPPDIRFAIDCAYELLRRQRITRVNLEYDKNTGRIKADRNQYPTDSSTQKLSYLDTPGMWQELEAGAIAVIQTLKQTSMEYTANRNACIQSLADTLQSAIPTIA